MQKKSNTILRREFLALASLSSLAFLTGCSSKKLRSPKEKATSLEGAKKSRIVSLLPSSTEWIYDLGMASSLVGVSDHCNYPSPLEGVSRLGGMEVSLEKLIRLSPSHIVLDKIWNATTLAKLERLNLSYIALKTDRWEGMTEQVQKLASYLGSLEAGEALIEEIEQTYQSWRPLRVSGRPLRVAVFYQVVPPFVAGKESFMSDLLAKMGVDNVYQDTSAYASVGVESLLKREIDFCLVEKSSLAELDEAKPDWWELFTPAKRGRVLSLEADLMSRPTMRNLRAMNEIYQKISSFD